jgi:mannose-6-phosphate isomerase-like protein (cupin superfamily)
MGNSSLIVDALAFELQNPVPAGKLIAVTHVHHTELSSTVIAAIRPGGGLRPHFHRDHDEFIVFLRGEATFRIGDELRRVKANDVITVPAGTTHATLRAKTECLLAAVFSPAFDPENEDRVYVD